MSLKDILLVAEKRPKVVKAAAQLVDSEVASKGGLSGMAIKTSYAMVSKIRPGLIEDVVDGLLDKFVDRLEPFYASWESAGRSGSFGGHMSGRSNDVANALLGVTDDRAKVVANRTLKTAYEKLRPQGEKHVEAAVPGLGRVIDGFLS